MSDLKIILIVDDSMSIRRELRAIIEKKGYDVREAGDGKMMNFRINENKIKVNLILMDISLKEENGFELVKQIKDNDEFKEIPIIMLTGHTEKKNVLTAKSIGVEGFLRKPIDPDMLIKRLEGILG
ncbi:MAG: response regulator [Clostridiales bacterium]